MIRSVSQSTFTCDVCKKEFDNLSDHLMFVDIYITTTRQPIGNICPDCQNEPLIRLVLQLKAERGA